MVKNRGSIVFIIFIIIIFSFFGWKATSFAPRASYFPLCIAALAVFLALIQLVLEGYSHIVNKQNKIEKDSTMAENEILEKRFKGAFYYLIWILGYIIVIYLIGLFPATFFFLITFLYFEAKMSKVAIGVAVLVTLGVLYTMGNIMTLYWPKSLFSLF